MIATVDDVLRFLLLFDPRGDRRLHSKAGFVRSMATDQPFGYRNTAEDYPIFK